MNELFGEKVYNFKFAISYGVFTGAIIYGHTVELLILDQDGTRPGSERRNGWISEEA